MQRRLLGMPGYIPDKSELQASLVGRLWFGSFQIIGEIIMLTHHDDDDDD